MKEGEKMKIVISDAAAAYGQYISKMFQTNMVLMASNFENSKLETVCDDSTLIFILNSVEEINLLKQISQNHFKNVIVCSELVDIHAIQLSKPYAFISLNQLKDSWLTAVFEAMINLNCEQVVRFFSESHKLYKKFFLNSGEEE